MAIIAGLEARHCWVEGLVFQGLKIEVVGERFECCWHFEKWALMQFQGYENANSCKGVKNTNDLDLSSRL